MQRKFSAEVIVCLVFPQAYGGGSYKNVTNKAMANYFNLFCTSETNRYGDFQTV